MTDPIPKRKRGRPARSAEAPPLLPYRQPYQVYANAEYEMARIDRARVLVPSAGGRSGWILQAALEKADAILAQHDQS